MLVGEIDSGSSVMLPRCNDGDELTRRAICGRINNRGADKIGVGVAMKIKVYAIGVDGWYRLKREKRSNPDR